MKTTRRFLFGLLSSLFLAVGLVRAAERFDPMSPAHNKTQVTVSSVAPDTEVDCLPRAGK